MCIRLKQVNGVATTWCGFFDLYTSLTLEDAVDVLLADTGPLMVCPHCVAAVEKILQQQEG